MHSSRTGQQPTPCIRPALTFALALFLFATTPVEAATGAQTASVRSSILALDSARQTALKDLDSLVMSSEEAADYWDFVVYLNTRIANYCTELAKQGGPEALGDLPCPGQPMTGSSRTVPIPSSDEIFYTSATEIEQGQTREEQAAGLEDEFVSALGDFDEMLLKEDEKIAARVPSQRESSLSEPTGASASSGGEGEAGEPGSADDPSEYAEGSSGSQDTSGTGSAKVDPAQHGAPGGKLPPPEDDDIVARQLREAAEKETDPELKKKLWEEYWKYKGVKRGA